jgi:protein ImuB
MPGVRTSMPGVRTLVAWFPDWPVVAAGHSPDAPVAVVSANRVVACSAAARAEGVTSGLRRREAQGRCPDLLVVAADPSRDLRAWEPAVLAVEALTPMVEVAGAGVVALATRGPSRYFGGDGALSVRVAKAVDGAVGAGSGVTGVRIGVADGRFAAELAARTASGQGDGGPITLVPSGVTPAWLAPLSVTTLDRPALTDLWARLGLRTLGDVAQLDRRSVLARFGPEGVEAHRLACGLDERPHAARIPPADLTVGTELDPPVERVDTVAFLARTLAEELHERLAASGLACTRIAIEVETEHGEHLQRLWRHDGALTAGAVAERVRWQLDGWLRARGEGGGASGGLTMLRLRPDEVRPDHGRQLGFWGGSAGGDTRVARALARVQGMLGPGGVVTAVVGGGRDPADQVRLVPWGDEREPARPASWVAGPTPSRSRSQPVEAPPWPGRLPGPAPAVIHRPALAAEVSDEGGETVAVTGRGALSAPPARVAIAGGLPQEVMAWAGPWPVEERWWDAGARRRARLQVFLADGSARLLSRRTAGGGSRRPTTEPAN